MYDALLQSTLLTSAANMQSLVHMGVPDHAKGSHSWPMLLEPNHPHHVPMLASCSNKRCSSHAHAPPACSVSSWTPAVTWSEAGQKGLSLPSDWLTALTHCASTIVSSPALMRVCACLRGHLHARSNLGPPAQNPNPQALGDSAGCEQAYGMMGARIGYLAIPWGPLGLQLLKAQDTIPICPAQISQRMALGALQAGSAWVQQQLPSLLPSRSRAHLVPPGLCCGYLVCVTLRVSNQRLESRAQQEAYQPHQAAPIHGVCRDDRSFPTDTMHRYMPCRCWTLW